VSRALQHIDNADYIRYWQGDLNQWVLG